MIDILVNGKKAVLYKDTSFQLELNSSVFATDAIEGDVVYNFDLPVSGNEVAFDFSHIPYSSSGKKYDCVVLVDGVQLVSGKMVIQKATRKVYSVGILANPFPDGFGDKSVRSIGGEEVVIARSYATREVDWKNFLQASLDQESDVKFGVFQDNKGYGDKNGSFALYGMSEEYEDLTQLQKIVNRMLTKDGVVVDDHPGMPFAVLFNYYSIIRETTGTSTYVSTNVRRVPHNVFCFCPQFRAVRCLSEVFSFAGYSVVGSLFSDDKLNKVYIQSPKALDGTVKQYSEQIGGAFFDGYDIHFAPDYSVVMQPDSALHYMGSYGYDPQYGTVLDNLVYIDVTYFVRGSEHISRAPNSPVIVFENSGYYRITFDVSVPMCDISIPLRILVYDGGPIRWEGDDAGEELYRSGEVWMPTDGSSKRVSFVLHITGGTGFWIKIFRIIPNYNGTSNYYMPVRCNSNIRIDAIDGSMDSDLNIYARSFVKSEYLPDVKVGEFVKTLKNSLGLMLFTDSQSKKVEISTVKDLISAGSVDLSEYVLVRESSREVNEESGYKFAFDKIGTDDDEDGDDVSVGDMIGDVDDVCDLPSAEENIGKVCYVKSRNAYYTTEWDVLDSGESSAVWVEKKGARRWLKVGDGSTEVSPAAAVPGITGYLSLHRGNGSSVMIPDIDQEIESDMFGTEKGEKIVLLMYRGHKTFRSDAHIQHIQTYGFEDMCPFSSDGLQLTSTGDDSVGEEYVKPLLEMISKDDTFSYKFLLPINKVLELMKLLKPQEAAASDQVRFVMVNNLRILPKKITFQLDNNGGKYLCEVVGVRV